METELLYDPGIITVLFSLKDNFYMNPLKIPVKTKAIEVFAQKIGEFVWNCLSIICAHYFEKENRDKVKIEVQVSGKASNSKKKK